MRLTDDDLQRLEWAAANAELPAYFATVLDAIAELRELRALLAVELPQRFSVWLDDTIVDKYRVGLSLRGESFVLEVDSAEAIAAALFRMTRTARAKAEGR